MSTTTQTTVLLDVSDNQGYAPDQIETSVTLASLLEAVQQAIEHFGEDAKVVLSNGQRYGAGFGRIATSYGEVEFRNADEDEEEGW